MNSSFHEQGAFERSLDTNLISETAPECKILPDGRVHCPVAIYRDRKKWRRSRHQVENEIQQLKEKLEKLKEIRRHLKHAKPSEAEEALNSTDVMDPVGFNQLHPNLEANYNDWFPMSFGSYENTTTERSVDASSSTTTQSHRRKNINNSSENHRSSKRRKFKQDFENVTESSGNMQMTEFGLSTSGNFSEVTTKAPNQHRHHHHHHHKHTTTQGPIGRESVVTEGPEAVPVISTSGPTIEKISTQKVCKI